jgi:uncharacterized membrane protein YeaQ/YmgE (transglycosylase-associated protein family)
MLVGFGCGFLAGAIIHETTEDGSLASMGLGWGLVGVPLGAGVGSLIRTPTWEPVPLAERTSHAPRGD